MKSIVMCVCASILLSLIGCVEDEIINIDSIELSDSALVVQLYSSYELIATTSPRVVDESINWYSSNSNVAEVVNGVITTLNVGSATILASSANSTSHCLLTVRDSNLYTVRGVDIDREYLNLEIDEMQQLSASLLPDSAVGILSWFSSDTTIVTVNDGLVYAVSPGSTYVRASSNGFSDSCLVTVAPIPVCTGISMSTDALSVAMQSSAALVATLEPTGFIGDITWTSSDQSIATVSNGIVTGIYIGEVTITATHGLFSTSAVVTVTPVEMDPNDLPEALNGTNYHLITLDDISYEFIKDKVDNDFRPDGDNTNLYIWDNTFSAGSFTGLNYFGQDEDWNSLVVESVGWSGAGFNVGEGYGEVDMTDLAAYPDDYVFHIAMKASGDASYLLILSDGVVEVKFAIGSTNYVDGDISYEPYTDFTRDNEWHSIEIPVNDLIALGLNFDTTFTNKNVLSFLAGGVGGTTMDMDAIFYYKK